MNHYTKCFFLILIIIPLTSFAEDEFSNQSDNYWECTTDDATNTHWTSSNFYQKIAINFSYALCKKNSKVPATCKTSKANCSRYIHGINVMPTWRCTALDKEALAWKSNLYRNREDAALAANAYCKQKSPVPDTCYINLITCKNTNEL